MNLRGKYVYGHQANRKIAIPMTEPGQHVEKEDSPEDIFGADGEYLFCEDATEGYGYEQGEYKCTRLKWNDMTRELTWDSERKYSYEIINI